MSKLKDLIMTWAEMYDAGVPMEWSIDKFNWFDAKEPPQFTDGKYYREKRITKDTSQNDDEHSP